MNMQEFFQLNTLPFGIIAYMLVIVISNRNYEPDLAKRFLIPTILLFVVVIDDNIDYFLYNIGDTSMLHRFTAVLGYDTRIAILVALTFIVLRNNEDKKKYLWGIPATICILVTSLAVFSDLVFWYEEGTGEIMRGPFSYTPHATLSIYVLYLCYLGVKTMIKDKNIEEGLVIIFGCFLNVIATLVESKYALRGILMGTVALVIVFYYLCLHTEYFKVDILTGAKNRLSFVADGKKFAGSIKALIMIDLNNLKTINDNQGHEHGDKALKTLVYIVSKCIPRGCYLYRTGGDEFVIIQTQTAKIPPQNIVDRIQRAMYVSKYSWAVGYASFDEEDSFESVLKKADENMYINKSMMKKIEREHPIKPKNK